MNCKLHNAINHKLLLVELIFYEHIFIYCELNYYDYQIERGGLHLHDRRKTM